MLEEIYTEEIVMVQKSRHKIKKQEPKSQRFPKWVPILSGSDILRKKDISSNGKRRSLSTWVLSMSKDDDIRREFFDAICEECKAAGLDSRLARYRRKDPSTRGIYLLHPTINYEIHTNSSEELAEAWNRAIKKMGYTYERDDESREWVQWPYGSKKLIARKRAA